YDIIKFCCAVKENPHSPNLKGWSRKDNPTDMEGMVFDNNGKEQNECDSNVKKMLSNAQRAQIYAMTAITALNSGNSEKAVWNAVRAQRYISHLEDIIRKSTQERSKNINLSDEKNFNYSFKDDIEANNLLDEFEKLIQMHDSYGAFRRLAAKRLGVSALKVTIQEVNEITKQVHRAYEGNPERKRKSIIR
ncbi:hypothetical protein OA005_02600, partial [Paracoccaceae bacterium]|nr:hypothetical protein [Paracoccaceae bacterium]